MGSGRRCSAWAAAAYTSEAEQIAREYWELSRSRLWTIRIISLLLAAAVAVAGLYVFGVLPPDGTGKRSGVTEFELKDIGELATVAATLSVNKTAEITRKVGPLDLSGTKSTYVLTYALVIKAGLDFDRIVMRTDDREHVIRITMPEIRILSKEAYLDSWEGGVNPMSQMTLDEMKTVQEAVVREAEKTARERGTLEEAAKNAERLISGLLAESYDMSVYTVEYRWP